MNEVRYAMGIREPQDVIYDYHCRDHGPESVAAGKAQYLYPHEKPVEWNYIVCCQSFHSFTNARMRWVESGKTGSPVYFFCILLFLLFSYCIRETP